MHLAIRHFRYFLDSRHFTVYTDRKPLIFAFSKISDPWSTRQQRQLTAISEFTTDIRHIAGKANVVANTLSRTQISSVVSTLVNLDSNAMAATLTRPEVQAYCTAVTNLRLEDIVDDDSKTTLLCDISTDTPKPTVPLSWSKQVFDAIHGLSHPSIRTTRKSIASKFVWHGLHKQVGWWAKQCTDCQKAKVQRHVRAPWGPYPTPIHRFEHVNIDFVGFLPSSQGPRFLLTMVDRFTRWPEAVSIMDATTLSCSRAFISHWVARFGIQSGVPKPGGDGWIYPPNNLAVSPPIVWGWSTSASPPPPIIWL